jgi:hypothetical protein
MSTPHADIEITVEMIEAAAEVLRADSLLDVPLSWALDLAEEMIRRALQASRNERTVVPIADATPSDNAISNR